MLGHSPVAPAVAALPGTADTDPAVKLEPSRAFDRLPRIPQADAVDALQAEARRDVLVTRSALGDPLLIGGEQVRELSGFRSR